MLNHDMSPLMRKALVNVFKSDWESASYNELKEIWQQFKESNPKDYSITIFAPKAEVFAGQTIKQKNGKLYVGGDVDRGKLDGSAIFNYTQDQKTGAGLNNYIEVVGAKNPLIMEKVSGTTRVENYIATLMHKLDFTNSGRLRVKDGIRMPVTPDSYEGIGELNWFDNPVKNIGDDASLALIVTEQLKDEGGVAFTFGNRLQETFTKLMESSREWLRQFESVEQNNENKWTYSGATQTFNTRQEAIDYINEHNDHIEYLYATNYNKYYIPKVRLTKETKAQLTNFNKVAASVTGVQLVQSEANKSTDVVLGTINTKDLVINSSGDVNIVSTVDQNAINADHTAIRTSENILFIGNANLGESRLNADKSANFWSNYYINNKGALYNQGLVSAKNLNIEANNVNLKAVKIQADSNLYVTSENNVELESRTNLASRIDSTSVQSEYLNTHTAQIGKFIVGSSLEAKNGQLYVDAKKDLNLESSTLASGAEANINVGENLNTSAKHDEIFIRGKDYRLFGNLSFNARFGGAYSWSERIRSWKANQANVNSDSTIIWENDFKPSLSSSRDDIASASVGVFGSRTYYEIYEKVTHNNALYAPELNVNVGQKAQLGDTNINSKQIRAEDGSFMEKNATIQAAEISQENSKNISVASVYNSTFGFGIETSASSSLNPYIELEQVQADGKYHDPVEVEDAKVRGHINFATRPVVGGNARLIIGSKEFYANFDRERDNVNLMSGNVNIKSTGDVALKAVLAPKLGELNIESKSLSVEGIKTVESNTYDQNDRTFSWSITLGLGATYPLYFNNKIQYVKEVAHATENLESYTNSVLNAQDVKIKNTESTKLDSSNINAVNSLELDTKNLEVTSKVSQYKYDRVGKVDSFNAGITNVVSVSLPYFVWHPTKKTEKIDVTEVNQVAGITSEGSLNVATDKLELNSGVIAGNQGTVTAKEADIKNYVISSYVESKERMRGYESLFRLIGKENWLENNAVRETRVHEINSTVNNQLDLQVDKYVEGDIDYSKFDPDLSSDKVLEFTNKNIELLQQAITVANENSAPEQNGTEVNSQVSTEESYYKILADTLPTGKAKVKDDPTKWVRKRVKRHSVQDSASELANKEENNSSNIQADNISQQSRSASMSVDLASSKTRNSLDLADFETDVLLNGSLLEDNLDGYTETVASNIDSSENTDLDSSQTKQSSIINYEDDELTDLTIVSSFTQNSSDKDSNSLAPSNLTTDFESRTRTESVKDSTKKSSTKKKKVEATIVTVDGEAIEDAEGKDHLSVFEQDNKNDAWYNSENSVAYKAKHELPEIVNHVVGSD